MNLTCITNPFFGTPPIGQVNPTVTNWPYLQSTCYGGQIFIIWTKNFLDESLGQWGEDRATAFLKSNGFSIEERNLSTSLGECDILAWENETLVFVEVKTRRSSEFGPPEAAVTRDKREHLRRVAKAIISDMNREVSCRFDVISIEMKGKESDITHIKNAFEGTE